MKVLLIGAGAREHAIGWALKRSGRVTELLSLPGNPGLARLGPVIEGVAATDVGAIAALSRVHAIDLVVVGPEAPLAAGVVDAVGRLGIPVFGPTRAAARLESSKSYAKDVMERAGVPTPAARSFDDRQAAVDHLAASPGPYVVKADGLAGGKGVLVTEDRARAVSWVERCLGGDFGVAGSTLVIEEYLEGPELSVFALCDGTDAVLLQPARDYKRLGDGDSGPNTGGMGSYSPVGLDDGLIDRVKAEVFLPTLGRMAEDGHPYRGFLYAGLILTDRGPQVIEFNVRLGDPETQVVLPRLDSDLVGVIETALGSGVSDLELEWSPMAAVDVVLASQGYPEATGPGVPISGADIEADDLLVFHAGTSRQGKRLMTDGGRVLSVVGLGPDLPAATARAYAAVHAIDYSGKTFRTDIAGPVR